MTCEETNCLLNGNISKNICILGNLEDEEHWKPRNSEPETEENLSEDCIIRNGCYSKIMPCDSKPIIDLEHRVEDVEKNDEFHEETVTVLEIEGGQIVHKDLGIYPQQCRG